MQSYLFSFLILFGLCVNAETVQQQPMSDISKMSWMAGSWVGEDKGHKLELNLTGLEGEIIIGNFKKLTPDNKLRFARFMNFRAVESGGVVLKLFPFFNPRDDYYFSIDLTDTIAHFHRVYPNEICNVSSVAEVLNDTGEQLKCDRFPVQIIYEHLPNGDFRETYLGYELVQNEYRDVSFSRVYKRK